MELNNNKKFLSPIKNVISHIYVVAYCNSLTLNYVYLFN